MAGESARSTPALSTARVTIGTSLRCPDSGRRRARQPLDTKTFQYQQVRLSRHHARRSQAHRLVQFADFLAGQHPDAARSLLPQRHRTDVGTHQLLDRKPTSASSRRTMRLRPSCSTTSPASCPAPCPPPRSRPPGPVRRPVRFRRAACVPSPRDRAEHRREVRLGHLVRRVHQPVRQLAVVGQQHQPLGVGVEPPDVKQLLVSANSMLDEVTDARPARSSDIVECMPLGC